ncbi:sugar ABC transporter permease [Paenibacillus baekrokdamisoli]|uniref:Sugar ABC transporter permease n=1 Tax=Paenibacillus baekrokdamisoli TaxID=1712516 RepID=A0A3G9IZ58_9BACL|nr:carbohydrate ABC transporter permease [Paenibacillus baekrokdamisoli]MBB3071800.1 ABC-type glycerol-3-phosphate transport system permease component [Paenibacillus baekrokdamisoli]BBH24217.1 sugar ABC transporter permease [Paenibacillus baekrokdamisoli]
MKNSIFDRWMSVIFYLFTAVFAILCLYPFLLVIASSITDETALLRDGYKLLPNEFSIAAYKAILTTNTIPKAYLITIFVTVVGTALSLLVTSMAAYALSGGRLYYASHIAMFFYFTMLFSGGMVSNYILITKYLHLKDSIWVYILPALLSPWNLFLMRNFFNDIPKELFESAKLEGAGETRVLRSIVLPLSLPALATIGLFYALGYWSAWTPAMLFIDNPNLYSLQYIIMQIIRNVDMAQNIAVAGAQSTTATAPAYTVRLATAMVTVGPIIFLYPFLQRYFVGGLKVGAIKG